MPHAWHNKMPNEKALALSLAPMSTNKTTPSHTYLQNCSLVVPFISCLISIHLLNIMHMGALKTSNSRV